MLHGMTRALRVIGIVFSLAWVVHTLALSGSAMLAVDHARLLRSSPMAAQQAQGKPYVGAAVSLNQTLPTKSSVLMIVDPSDFNGGYAKSWTAYWLYPRSVRLTSSPAAAANAPEDAIVYVQSSGRPAIDTPAGYVVDRRQGYPDGTVVISYLRAGA